MCWRRYALDSRASRFTGWSFDASLTLAPARQTAPARRPDAVASRAQATMPPRAPEPHGSQVSEVGRDRTLRARARALDFVEARGDELARRRARALVGRARAADVAEWLARLQLADGAFPADPTPGAPSSLRATRRALGTLADLGHLHGALVERAVDHLARAQRADGSWSAEGEGSERATLESTGRIAGLLARTPCVRARCPDAAAEWLAVRFAPERVQGFAWGPLAAYAATFANVPHEGGDAILHWCGRELERCFRAGAFGAVRTARVLLDCDAPSLPGAKLDPAEILAALVREQASDGGWPPPGGGDDERVASALHALAALSRLRRGGPR